MDKTLLRHRTRRHSLYREGAAQIALACREDRKKQLTNQWLKFCIWSISQEDGRLDTLESVTREHVIRYGRYLRTEFLNGNYASTAAPLGYLSALNTVMKAIRGDTWQTVSPPSGLRPGGGVLHSQAETGAGSGRSARPRGIGRLSAGAAVLAGRGPPRSPEP